MKSFLVVFAIASLCACSAARFSIGERGPSIDQVTRIGFGKSVSEDIVKILGQPNRVIPVKMFTGKDAWIYDAGSGAEAFERLGLLVDRKTGLVESGTWSVRDGDPLRDQAIALEYFRGGKFEREPVGAVAKDYYSIDSIHRDVGRGIAIYVDETKHYVTQVSFWGPAKRKVAAGS